MRWEFGFFEAFQGGFSREFSRGVFKVFVRSCKGSCKKNESHIRLPCEMLKIKCEIMCYVVVGCRACLTLT